MDALSAIATSVAATQTQTSLLAVRLANESQRQVVDLLAQSAAPTPASNPAHLGTLIDTSA